MVPQSQAKLATMKNIVDRPRVIVDEINVARMPFLAIKDFEKIFATLYIKTSDIVRTFFPTFQLLDGG